MNHTLDANPDLIGTKRSPHIIGIVGGGQLGRMMAVAAKQLGFSVIVSDPTPNSPAGQVADKQIIGAYKDDKTIRELAKEADVITVDAEFVNTDTLSDLEKGGKKVYPSPQTIEMIKDKLLQKQFLQKHKIATAEFIEIPYSSSEAKPNREVLGSARTIKEIERAAEEFGYPLLLKARTDAYDGKGNFVLQSRSTIKQGLEKLQGRELYVEKFVPFAKELAVMVARAVDGTIAVYPVVETVHKNNILDYLIVPATISETAKNHVTQLASATMRHLQGAGVFGIEMFLTKDDNVLVNELAPRVHNSGHYSIEACVTSQFEQHIRAITGLPLGSTALLCRAVVMKNILGEQNGPGIVEGLEKALAIPHVSVHIYGKHESRPGRKMGHITVVGETVDQCLKKANEARKALVI